MEYTTGLTDDEFDELLVRPREEGVEGRPPILSLSGSPRATLIYLRHNIVQTAIGELPGVLAHCFAGRQGPDGGDRPDPEGAAAHRRGGARGLRLSWWTAPSSSAGADATAAIRSRGERGRAGMSVRIPVLPAGGFVRAPGVHARRGRPGRPRTARGDRPLRVDRQQGIREKRDDYTAQESPQRRTERGCREGVQERQQDPPGSRADHHRRTLALRLQNHPLNNLRCGDAGVLLGDIHTLVFSKLQAGVPNGRIR